MLFYLEYMEKYFIYCSSDGGVMFTNMQLLQQKRHLLLEDTLNR
jgi:hypothetical protein